MATKRRGQDWISSWRGPASKWFRKTGRKSIWRELRSRFGKGRHAAALNIGDCASYALAKSRDLPLLFKGNDFSRTDMIEAV